MKSFNCFVVMTMVIAFVSATLITTPVPAKNLNKRVKQLEITQQKLIKTIENLQKQVQVLKTKLSNKNNKKLDESTEDGNQKTGTVIRKFSGVGNKKTSSFTVHDEWKIKWKSMGEKLKIFLYQEEYVADRVVDQDGSGSGVSSYEKEGKFRLGIIATGAWEIEVVNAGP